MNDTMCIVTGAAMERRYFCTDVRQVARDYSLPDLGMRHEMVIGDRDGERFLLTSVDLSGLLDLAFDYVDAHRVAEENLGGQLMSHGHAP